MAKFAFWKTYVSGEMISWGDYVFSFWIFGFWRQIYNFPWGWSNLRKNRVFGKNGFFLAFLSVTLSLSFFLAVQWWTMMHSMCYTKYMIYGAAARAWGVTHGLGQMMLEKQVPWFKSSKMRLVAFSRGIKHFCMKKTHSFRRHKPLSHELGNEWVSERMSGPALCTRRLHNHSTDRATFRTSNVMASFVH